MSWYKIIIYQHIKMEAFKANLTLNSNSITTDTISELWYIHVDENIAFTLKFRSYKLFITMRQLEQFFQEE